MRITMIGAQICVRTVSFKYVSMADQTIACGSFPTSFASCSPHFSASTISCDGDFVLPILVGEFAVEKLKDGQSGNGNGNSPDHIQFIRNLVEKLGYEAEENEMLSVDRPSDAINVANRCKVPIYVSKQIVFTDAIKFGYGKGRLRNKKSTYDVRLDSATEGTDSVAEELNMMTNMNSAILEERYKDAAMWREKLAKLRKTKPE